MMNRLALALLIAFAGAPAFSQDDLFGDASLWEEFDEWDDEATEEPWLHGFFSVGVGAFLRDDGPMEKAFALGEYRLRLESERQFDQFALSAKGDLLFDGVTDSIEGELRELTVAFSPVQNIDVTAGRQVLTWGTGDLVFLNDLFPKDWQSFFSGREQSYLKAPGNAVKAAWYGSAFNVDLVVSPRFDSDNYLTGERFSYFSPLAGEIVAAPPKPSVADPDFEAANAEVATRVYDTTAGGLEWALYGYRGFSKQPTAIDPASGALTFAPLSVYGASMRTILAGGIINAETAYHHSRNDTRGTDPFTSNSQWRFLIGYERELATKLTLAVQYYLERTLDHDALVANSPFPAFEADEHRHLLTTRLTWMLKQDNLTLSLFSYWSPSDVDAYFRPSLDYRLDDHLTFSAGANLFTGKDKHTFFGQLRENDNAWLRATYAF